MCRRRDRREGVVVVDGRQVVPVMDPVVAEVAVSRARETGASRQGDLWTIDLTNQNQILDEIYT